MSFSELYYPVTLVSCHVLLPEYHVLIYPPFTFNNSHTIKVPLYGRTLVWVALKNADQHSLWLGLQQETHTVLDFFCHMINWLAKWNKLREDFNISSSTAATCINIEVFYSLISSQLYFLKLQNGTQWPRCTKTGEIAYNCLEKLSCLFIQCFDCRCVNTNVSLSN